MEPVIDAFALVNGTWLRGGNVARKLLDLAVQMADGIAADRVTQTFLYVGLTAGLGVGAKLALSAVRKVPPSKVPLSRVQFSKPVNRRPKPPAKNRPARGNQSLSPVRCLAPAPLLVVDQLAAQVGGGHVLRQPLPGEVAIRPQQFGDQEVRTGEGRVAGEDGEESRALLAGAGALAATTALAGCGSRWPVALTGWNSSRAPPAATMA